MKCSKCGYESENAKFCPTCGSQLESYSIPLTKEAEELQQKKNNKTLIKLLLILLGSLITIIVLFFLIKMIFFNKESNNLNRVFNENNLILIEKNNLYGYINSKGKIIIEPKYNKANNFTGEHTLVTLKNETSKTGFEYQIIDKKGNIKYKTINTYDIDYISEYNLWIIEDVLFDGNINPITKKDMYIDYEDYGYFTYEDYSNNTSGVIDNTGKVIFKWEYDSINMDIAESYTNDYYAEIENYDDKSVIISLKTGKILYENPDVLKYNIASDENNIFKIYNNKTYETVDYLWFKDEKLAFQLNGIAYDVELKNENVLEIDYGYNYDEKYNKHQRYYYYDYKTQKLLEQLPQSDIKDATIVINGYVEFSCPDKKGIMNGEQTILPCEYDDIEYLNQKVYEYLKTYKNMDLVIVSLNKEIYLYDLNKKQAIHKFELAKMYNIDTYSSTFIISKNTKNNTQNVYNILTNKELNFSTSSNIKVYTNYITVKENNKTIYYNTNLEKIYEI